MGKDKKAVTKEDPKICPLLVLSLDTRNTRGYTCMQERCAWWIKYTDHNQRNKGSDPGSCAVQLLGYLYNVGKMGD